MAAVRRLFFFCRRPAVTFSYLNSNQVYSYFFPTTYIGRNTLHNMIAKKTYFPIFSHTATAILLIRRLRTGSRIIFRHKDKRSACTICGQLRLLKFTILSDQEEPDQILAICTARLMTDQRAPTLSPPPVGRGYY